MMTNLLLINLLIIKNKVQKNATTLFENMYYFFLFDNKITNHYLLTGLCTLQYSMQYIFAMERYATRSSTLRIFPASQFRGLCMYTCMYVECMNKNHDVG